MMKIVKAILILNFLFSMSISMMQPKMTELEIETYIGYKFSGLMQNKSFKQIDNSEDNKYILYEL